MSPRLSAIATTSDAAVSNSTEPSVTRAGERLEAEGAELEPPPPPSWCSSSSTMRNWIQSAAFCSAVGTGCRLPLMT